MALPVLLLLTSHALAGGGGGGVTLDGTYYPRYGDLSEPYEAPGLMGCFGATGWGYNNQGFRIGGQATACRGRAGVRMGYGGVDLGYHRERNGIWGAATVGVGLGGFHDRTSDTGPYDTLFAYVDPGFKLGFAWGFSGIELGVHAMTPIQLVQWVSAGEGRGFVQPTVGGQVSFLFGSFRQRQWVQATPYQAPQDQPLAIPGPDSPPPQDPPPDDRPLAIPADEASYPPPPPPQ